MIHHFITLLPYRYFFVAFTAFISPFTIGADTTQFDRCFNQAANRFDVDALLIKAIAKKESSLNPKAINIAKDGTEAVGIMQIHSQWYSRVKTIFGGTRDDLLENTCLNIHVGTWILSQNFDSHGVNWNSVGAYMAGFAKKHQKLRDKYADKVRIYYHNLKLKQQIMP